MIFNKLGIFTKLKISIFNVEEYQILGTRKLRNTILYVMFLMLVYSVVGVGIFIHKSVIEITNINEIINNFIYIFTLQFFTVLIDIFILSIFALIVTKIIRITVKYTAIYNIAAYSLTLPIVLNIIYVIVNQYTGFEIIGFEILYIILATVYICAALLIIRIDIIVMASDLLKIKKEQENIKNQMELQKKQEDKENQEHKINEE